MRAAAIGLGLLLALAGCRREPDFDERYKSAQERIARTAADIEAQVDATGAPTPLASPQ
ncbi:hypothetical protein [Novosphingobium colocasiae]|uniref:hypothetical protein n=1 Tax=Novosphingobium colocasiae TaxID=1256513 RepID=UPI0035AEBA6A